MRVMNTTKGAEALRRSTKRCGTEQGVLNLLVKLSPHLPKRAISESNERHRSSAEEKSYG